MAVKKVENFNIHETPAINQNEFDVETYLNANWGKTKEAVNNNAEELMQVQKDISTLKEDNKTNKESIETLQAENLEIKAENERLREDIKSIATIGKASGENIHIEDSSNARCEIEICGNQKQNTREGYNLLNNDDLNLSSKTLQTKRKLKIDANTEYSIVSEKEFTDVAVNAFSDDINYEKLILTKEKQNKQYYYKFTTKSDTQTIYFYVVSADKYTNVNDFVNSTKLMLIKGSKATDYEQYGASPSIDYPSEVKSVNGSAKIDIFNKNYLSTIPQMSFSLQGIQTTFDGEKFICKGTAMYNYFNLTPQRIAHYFRAGIYTFSSNAFAKGRACMSFYYKDGTADTYYSNINTRKISFTLKKDAYEYFLMVDGLTVGGGDLIDYIIKLQLEDGNTATQIEKAENQEYLVDVQQEMLEGDTFVKQDGKWYEKHCWEKIIVDGENVFVNVVGVAGGRTWARINGGTWDNSKDTYSTSKKIKCTHFRVSDSWENNTMYGKNTSVGMSFQFLFDNNDLKTVADVNKALKAQYEVGTTVIIYYKLAEPTMLECTEVQNKVLDEIYNKSHTYKNITNISAESAEVNPIINIKYLKDPETEHNKLQAQINEIKQLLSTTQTSSMLLDNMQKDLESEV